MKSYLSPTIFKSRFSKKSIFVYLTIVLIYLGFIFLSMGIRSDHLLLLSALSVLYFLSESTHRFMFGLFPIIISWWLLDAIRLVPGYSFNEAHIQDLYEAELTIFGIISDGIKVTPNQFLQQFDYTFLHLLTGFTYLMWIPIPCILCLILYFKSKKNLLPFTICFLLTNLVGIVLYYLYPAAPPWYVDAFGFEFHEQAQGSAARLIQFDAILGIPIFEGIYAQSFNVFGAVPSLHSAYPVVSFFYAWKAKLRISSYVLFIYMWLTWFTAVFTNHHYVIDVLLGIVCAIVAITVIEQILLKSKFKKLLNFYEAY